MTFLWEMPDTYWRYRCDVCSRETELFNNSEYRDWKIPGYENLHVCPLCRTYTEALDQCGLTDIIYPWPATAKQLGAHDEQESKRDERATVNRGISTNGSRE